MCWAPKLQYHEKTCHHFRNLQAFSTLSYSGMSSLIPGWFFQCCRCIECYVSNEWCGSDFEKASTPLHQKLCGTLGMPLSTALSPHFHPFILRKQRRRGLDGHSRHKFTFVCHWRNSHQTLHPLAKNCTGFAHIEDWAGQWWCMTDIGFRHFKAQEKKWHNTLDFHPPHMMGMLCQQNLDDLPFCLSCCDTNGHQWILVLFGRWNSQRTNECVRFFL